MHHFNTKRMRYYNKIIIYVEQTKIMGIFVFDTETWDNPKERCEVDKLLFTALPFCLQLWFRGVNDATFEITVLTGWINWTHVINICQIGHSQSFLLIPHVWGCRLYKWMRKLIHQDIGKSLKYGQQLCQMLLKLDCEESVTESTQGKIYAI